MKTIRYRIVGSVILIASFLIFAISAQSIDMPDSPCNSDCTTYDEICHAECDGINGCSFNQSYVSRFGQTIKEVCNLQKKGWIKYFNRSYDIQCCTGQDDKPHKRLNETQLIIEQDQDVKDVSTLSRLITYNGELVTMYVTVWVE